MKLVNIDNFELKFEDELLLLKPFRKLYKADRTTGKTDFLNFLTVLYYVYDPRSDFQYIINDDLRLKEVCDANGIKVPKFTDSELACIELYKKMTVSSYTMLLRSTRVAMDKLRDFFETKYDPTEENEKGMIKYPINTVVAATKQIPALVKELLEMEKAVEKQLAEQSKARGDSEMSMLDSGININ